MKVWANGEDFILEVDREDKEEIAGLMAYRGLTFSTSASRSDKAILWSTNPYSLADLGDGIPELQAYYDEIEASRALDGVGTHRLPPGKELWPFQRASFDYALNRDGGIIGDQPGLGKTPISLALCNHWEAYRILVIVPASIRLQWAERIREWSTISRVNVAVMLRPRDGIHPTAHYQVLSYDSARKPEIIRAIGKYKWDALICDEAHKMKNIEALTTRAVLGNNRGRYVHKDHDLPAIATHCEKKMALTGTLLLNRPSEAFTLIRYFDHTAIDGISWEEFKDRYNRQALMKTIHGKRFNLERTSLESELQNRLRANVMTRHLKADVMDQLDVPRYSLVRVEGDRAVKDALEFEGLLGLDIDEIQTTKDFEILGHIAEARRLMGEAMAPHVVNYARDFLEGSEEKLVIFGWHISVLDILEEGLHQFGTVRVDGSKTPVQREKARVNFIDNPAVRVFMGNIQSAGTGLDGLQTVCSRCYLAEPDWVPSQNEQAVARLDRLGQKADWVNAELFVAPGSIIEKILIRALEKMNVIHRVLDHKEK